MSHTDFRPLTNKEQAILARLAEAPLPDIESIKRQMARAQAKTLDANGSLEFRVASGVPAISIDGALVTGSQADEDTTENYSPYVQCVLFSRNGFISHLDVYKDDGSKIKTTIDPAKFILTYGTPPKS